MTRCVTTIVAALVVASAAPTQGRQESLFRARTDAVLVSVAVRDKNRPVAGLAAEDFELLDNGVRQELTSTSVEAVPVDVALVLDTSGSLDGPAFANLKADIQRMADLLKPDDRVRLVTFASRVFDVLGLQPGTASLPLDRLTAGGGTSLYNALATALMMSPAPDRAQLVFTVTDGVDSGSFMDPRRLVTLARYSSATLYLTLVPQRVLSRLSVNGVVTAQTHMPVVPHRQTLQDVVAAAGGVIVNQSSSLPDLFQNVLQDFRTTYVLRYTPRGVPAAGWHDIAVKVPKRANLSVRARKGYERN